MPETLTLSTPVAQPSKTAVSFTSLEIDNVAERVIVRWVDNTGEPGAAVYPTPAPD